MEGQSIANQIRKSPEVRFLAGCLEKPHLDSTFVYFRVTWSWSCLWSGFGSPNLQILHSTCSCSQLSVLHMKYGLHLVEEARQLLSADEQIIVLIALGKGLHVLMLHMLRTFKNVQYLRPRHFAVLILVHLGWFKQQWKGLVLEEVNFSKSYKIL